MYHNFNVFTVNAQIDNNTNKINCIGSLQRSFKIQTITIKNIKPKNSEINTVITMEQQDISIRVVNPIMSRND